MPTYSFEPCLLANFEHYTIESEYMDTILQWYKNQIKLLCDDEDAVFPEIKIINMYVRNGRIYFESINEINEFDLETLIDPDSDGNDPITLDGDTYLVCGNDFRIEIDEIKIKKRKIIRK